MQLAFAGPAVLFVAAMLVIPLAFTIWLSLTDTENAIGQGSFVGLDNYGRMLGDVDRFWAAAGRTLLFTVGAVAVQLVLGTGIALLLQKHFRGRGIVRVLVILPLVATPVAVGMMWLMILEPNIGFANQALGALGISPQGWLTDPNQALATLVFIDVWQWTPMIALIIMAGLTTVPNEPIEAALVDGANAVRRFVHVVLPIIWPTVLVAVLLRSIEALKTFDIIYALKGPGGGAFHEAETLNIYGYSLTFEFGEYGYASAVLMGFFLLVTLACAVLVLMRGRASDNLYGRRARKPASTESDTKGTL